MLVVVIVAAGSVSAVENVTTDIDVHTEEIEIDDSVVEEFDIEDVTSDSDVDDNSGNIRFSDIHVNNSMDIDSIQTVIDTAESGSTIYSTSEGMDAIKVNEDFNVELTADNLNSSIERQDNQINENELCMDFDTGVFESSNEDLIINPDFDEDLLGWDSSANVNVEEGVDAHGSSGKYVKLSAKDDYISQEIDWTNINSLSFYAKSGTKMISLNIQIEGYTLTDSPWVLTKNTDWTEKIINTSSITGVSKLTISSNTKSDAYLDLFTIPVEDSYDFNINSYVNAPTYFNYTTFDVVDTWYWDFGDGSYSIDSNPIHIYNETGNYAGNLTIFNGTDSKVLTFSVEVIEKLKADFSYSIKDNGDVSITDQSSGSIVKWCLNNGNGGIYNYDKSFKVSFNYPQGFYNITLNVTDKFGIVFLEKFIPYELHILYS